MNLLEINAIEEQMFRDRKTEIEANFEYMVVLLGGSGVGKSSFMNKLNDVYNNNTSIVSLVYSHLDN